MLGPLPVDIQRQPNDLEIEESAFSKDNEVSSKGSLNTEGSWWAAKTIEEAVKGTDAVLILTEWNRYCNIIYVPSK